jgi:hypothetical protein
MNAAILGAVSEGDVIEGVVDEVDSNWLRLSKRAGATRDAFVMIEHPKLGRLLSPMERPAVGRSDGAFVVHVPRRMQAATAKRQATQLPTTQLPTTQRPVAAQRPAAQRPAAQRPEPKSPRVPAAAAGGESKRPADRSASPPSATVQPATARAELAAARRAEKRSKGEASAVEALSLEALSVLSECAASPDNVQSPKEAVEAWVAVDGGGFAPLATA